MVPTNGWVTDFHEAFDIPPTDENRAGRWRLLREEIVELKKELDAGNRRNIARELADVVYACYGTALVWDIKLDEALREVHRANMAKLAPDGKPIKDEHGKVLKPPRWKPPDMTPATPPGPIR